jgi:hypothetical protein
MEPPAANPAQAIYPASEGLHCMAGANQRTVQEGEVLGGCPRQGLP